MNKLQKKCLYPQDKRGDFLFYGIFTYKTKFEVSKIEEIQQNIRFIAL
jgi:hypothetical protein